MKKIIITAIIIICLGFTLGGTYIIISMETATSQLDHVISLHQIEILREQLLVYLKKVQSDLSLKNTQHARSVDTVIDNVRFLDKSMARCMGCHQSAAMLQGSKQNEYLLKRLYDLKSDIAEYKTSLSRYLTMRANRNRTEIEFDKAFHTTERLVTEVNTMVHTTNARLAEKTESSFREISQTKIILYIMVVLAPFLTIGLGFVIVRKVAQPVEALSQATARIKDGDLDYRIEGLADEFEEVAASASFNEMSDSLKHHIRELEESEKRYRTLFESAGDAIFIVEGEGENPGKIVDANPAAAAMHGYTLDELLQLNLVKDLDAPDAAKEAPERIQRILKGEWIQAEINHLKKDGTVFPVEISAGLLTYMDRKYVLAVDRDISDRKKMESYILQSKLDWEDTFDTITDIITIHDKDFNIIRANKAAKEMLKLPSLEVTKAIKCYEYYHGTDCPPENCLSCVCLETGTPDSFEIFEPHLNKYLEIRAMPRFDRDNQVVGLIHVIRDISERKKVEEELQRAEQMKTVGEWATGQRKTGPLWYKQLRRLNE
jgi:two-component system sensor histidine kinase AtoS